MFVDSYRIVDKVIALVLEQTEALLSRNAILSKTNPFTSSQICKVQQ